MRQNDYMQRCINLAQLGQSSVAPNPMVGAVLVYNDVIISEGYHHQFGAAHAEIDCFQGIPAPLQEKHILKASTLYVNLEPCCHHGKTPPCTEAIIRLGIGKVVIGCVDSNPLVQFKGIQALQQAGIEVVYPILEKECLELNKRFFYVHQHHTPYVILKWAESLNACIATQQHQAVAISDPISNFISHRWRANEMAIMVGTKTALNDNPALTTRYVNGKNPVKILIDRKLIVPRTQQIFQGSTKCFVFNERVEKTEGNIHFIHINFKENILPTLLSFLYQNGISSLLVEGGATLLQSFIDAALWQEARIIKSNVVHIPNGLPAPQLHHATLQAEQKGDKDSIFYYYPTS